MAVQLGGPGFLAGWPVVGARLAPPNLSFPAEPAMLVPPRRDVGRRVWGGSVRC